MTCRNPRTIQTVLAFIVFCAGCAAHAEVGRDADAGDDGFPQWWDDRCVTSQGMCTDPHCGSVQIDVVSPACDATTEDLAGCIPTTSMISSGWTCFVRTADHAILQSLVLPVTLDGLESCWEAGVTKGLGERPCPDL